MSEDYRLHLLDLGRLYRSKGRLHPLVIIEGAQETLYLDVDSFWGDHPQRVRLMSQLGGSAGFGIDAQRIYVLVDIWHSSLAFEDGDLEKAKAAAELVVPSEDPKREQALQAIEVHKDGNEAITWQPYVRTKRKLVWSEPHSWDQESFEDYTFGSFWAAVFKAEATTAAFAKALGISLTEPSDTGLTGNFHARRAARTVAYNYFGKTLFGEEELPRKARSWSKP